MSVLAPGPFCVPGGLSITIVDGQRDYGPAVAARAAALWRQELKTKPHLFDGEVWSVAGYGSSADDRPEVPEPTSVQRRGGGLVTLQEDVGSQRLALSLQRSRFRYHMLHMEEAKAATRRGNLSWNAMCAGVAALTVTQDGYLCLAQRSLQVTQCRGQWSMIPAGMVDSPDILQVLAQEFQEEMGIHLPPLFVGSWTYDADGERHSFEILDSPARGVIFRQCASKWGERGLECHLEQMQGSPWRWRGSACPHELFLQYISDCDAIIIECKTWVTLPLAPRRQRAVTFEATARRRLHAPPPGASRSDVGDLQCLGLFEAGAEQGWKPDLIFVVRLNLDRDEVLKRIHVSQDGLKEHHKFEMLPIDSDDHLRHFATARPCTATLVAAMRHFVETRPLPEQNAQVFRLDDWGRFGYASSDRHAVLVQGHASFAECKVSLLIRGGGRADFSPEVQAEAKLLASKRRAASASWYDGQLWSLCAHDWHAESRSLTLELQRCQYSFHCLQLDEAKSAHSRDELRCVADILGVAIATLTADGHICVAQRSIILEECNAMWHLVPSGTLEPEVLDADGLQAWAMARLAAELGVAQEEVSHFGFLALVRTGAEQGWKPDLVFTCRLRLAHTEVLERFASVSGSPGSKHSELECVGPLPVPDGPADRPQGDAARGVASLQSFVQSRPVVASAKVVMRLLLRHGDGSRGAAARAKGRCADADEASC